MNAKVIEVGTTGSQSITETKAKFVRYIGGCFLNRRGVALYDVGNGYRLQIETARGGRVTSKNEHGNTYVIPAIHVSAEQLDSLMSEWTEGCHSGDAQIVERAMQYIDR